MTTASSIQSENLLDIIGLNELANFLSKDWIKFSKIYIAKLIHGKFSALKSFSIDSLERSRDRVRERSYCPDIGRFISVDPDAGSLGTPLTVVNKYIYTINNPINFTDSTVRSIFDDLGKWGSLALGGFLLGPLGQ